MSFVELLRQVPAPAWGLAGAIVGVVGTLAATALSNNSNNQRFEKQLEHDAEQGERNRLATLRKEIYLQAPREAAKALAYLGRLPTRDLSKIGEDEGISGYAAVAAQIAAISEMPTVKAVGRLGVTFTSMLMDALVELEGVQSLRTDIDIRRDRLEEVTKEIKRMQAEQQQMSESGIHDKARSESLIWWRDKRIDEAEKIRIELNALYGKHQRALYEYHKVAVERWPAMTALQTDAMTAIRKEIGLAHDLDEYEIELEQQAANLRTKMLKMMQCWAEKMEGDSDED